MEDENVSEKVNSQKRARSPSPSSSGESECSSGSPKRRRRTRRDSQTVSYVHFEFLSQQVAFLTNLITKEKESVNANLNSINDAVNSNDHNLRIPEDNLKNQLNILSEIGTTIKDPVYVKADDKLLAKLTELQHFNQDDWYAIRFSDAQKKYLATPGFVELKVNDELKKFEAAALKEDNRSFLLERSYAALSNALLCQKDELQKSLQNLVDWASNSKESLTSDLLFEKIQTLFSKESNYCKVTDDLLQLVCGRRADLIKLRREALLRQITEDFHRGVLHKIPPSSQFLFKEDSVQNYFQKMGGADKLTSSLRRIPDTRSQSNYYSNPKPSTSKQSDSKIFRRKASAKKENQSNQAGVRRRNSREQRKGKKSYSQSSAKHRRRE